MSIDLLASTSRVETPFIYVTIGDYTFGKYQKEIRNVVGNNETGKRMVVTYPNYMQSLSIDKLNGQLNRYTLIMKYAISFGDDPNLLEKVFSTTKNTRTLKISYGDLSVPSFIYKEEEALITDIQSQVDLSSSSITYTISCQSKALAYQAGNLSFPRRFAKPSDVIKEILYDKRYGLLDVFTGMIDREKVLAKNLIAGDDQAVQIEAKQYINILDYLNYLVSCMSSVRDQANTILKTAKYVLTISDDITNNFEGPYFKVTKVSTKVNNYNNLDTYEINIGNFSKDLIIGFTVDDNQTYSILYDYSNKIQQSNYIYRINNEGEIDYSYSPVLSNSQTLMKTTEADKTWWTQVTQLPVNATLTLKGLLRPALLMSYLKINVYFFGRKHISSGLYIITRQTDRVDSSGYRTTLNLSRIGGDQEYDN